MMHIFFRPVCDKVRICPGTPGAKTSIQKGAVGGWGASAASLRAKTHDSLEPKNSSGPRETLQTAIVKRPLLRFYTLKKPHVLRNAAISA